MKGVNRTRMAAGVMQKAANNVQLVATSDDLALASAKFYRVRTFLLQPGLLYPPITALE